jgi:hypothetical protein
MMLTKPGALLLCALVGGLVSGGGQFLLASLGESVIIPPLTWGVSLALVGAIVLGLAWPIRQSLHNSTSRALLDPFYSTRVLLLAKASALAGAGLTGGAVGLGVFFITRPVVSSSALGLVGLAALGALFLCLGALVAERWCALPPDAPDSLPGGQPEGSTS